MIKTINYLRSGFEHLRDFIIPPACLLCDRFVAEQGGCCPSCWKQIRFISRPYCEIMGIPFSYDRGREVLSAEAIANPPVFEKLRSAVIYDAFCGRLVRQLKYADRPELAQWMAGWMISAAHDFVDMPSLVVPVPLHYSRLRQRKFNQSAELARAFAVKWNGAGVQTRDRKRAEIIFAPGLLKRIRATDQQVGLSQNQRQRNVQGAFGVDEADHCKIKGQSIILIDDVYTSGATMNAAARALKRAGVKTVNALSFARTAPNDFSGDFAGGLAADFAV